MAPILLMLGLFVVLYALSGIRQINQWEVALRFTLGQPGVHCAIIGTTNPDNARRNIAYADNGPLSAEAVAKIREAFKRADPQGKWTGQT